MRLFRTFMALSCVAFLAFGGLTFGVSDSTANASTAQASENEPNNDPLSAQALPFPGPGQTVTLTGAIRAGDTGSFSEEMETFFAYAGGIGALQDWYVLDPDAAGIEGGGPISLKVSCSWTPGATDLDIYAGFLVDDSLFYFDGFKFMSGFDMGTLANPETWPNPGRNGSGESLGLYLQPNGVIVDGQPIPNDGYGRKLVIAVQHYDGPAANYTLTVENGATAKTFSSETQKVDDGGISTTWFGGPAGLLSVNCYRPSRYPATLTAISHPFVWFGGVPDPTGQQIQVVVLKGDDDSLGSEPPALSDQASVLYNQMVAIPGTISSQQGSRFIDRVVEIPINPPITINEGVVYVGFALPNRPIAETGVAVAFGINPVQLLRSFISSDGGATWGRPVQTDDDLSGEDLFTNLDVRARFNYGAAKNSEATPSPAVRGIEVPAGQLQQSVGIRPLQ